MKEKILLIITFFLMCILITPNVFAKYIMSEKIEIINIEKADAEKPYINNRNYDIDYESYKTEVTINYFDNLKIKYAKYWFNEKEKSFDREGIDFDSGKIFNESGFYKIEVSDMYENKTIYYFVIDKEVNYADLQIESLDDNGGTLIINAKDYVSGIQKIELFINNSIYKTYTYNEDFIKSKVEKIYVNIDNLPFYEESYIIVTDCYGNTLESNRIIPNKNRIYDLQDFLKFRTILDNNITNFSGQGIYLLNDIDLSSVCSSSKGSWSPVGNGKADFSGVFEGNNHTISNLYVNTTLGYRGLFKKLSGTIQNLNLKGTIVNAGVNSGAFVGALLKGEIKNCKNYVKITANNAENIGGIAGLINTSCKVSYCINYSNISGYKFIGGIAGYNQNGNISYCGNTGAITASNEFAGGITGYVSQSSSADAISYSYNTSNITGQSCVGGIAGAAWTGSKYNIIFSYVYNTGIINATRTNSNTNVGGILGATYYNWSTIKDYSVNKINNGYNYGVVISGYNNPNQVCPMYATVTNVYYVQGRKNNSGYGKAVNSNLFSTTSNTSVYYYLNQAKPGVWTVNTKYNSGKVCLLWQTEN